VKLDSFNSHIFHLRDNSFTAEWSSFVTISSIHGFYIYIYIYIFQWEMTLWLPSEPQFLVLLFLLLLVVHKVSGSNVLYVFETLK
jgi:hypothetical protein